MRLEKILELPPVKIKQAARRSQDWYAGTVKTLQVKAPHIFQRGHLDRASRIIPGTMYLYQYDPKHKATLPYYDIFPLVFPFASTDRGFIGLNMHYLPYRQRMILMSRLLDYRNNNAMDDTTRLRYSWDTIKAASKLEAAKLCIHEYLYSHLQTPLHIVPADKWGLMLLLPVQQFVGISAVKLWSQTRLR